MRFEVHTATRVEDIGQQMWDSLGQQAFESYQWHQFAQQVLANDLPFYVLLCQSGKPIARATFWLSRQEPLPIQSLIIRNFMQSALRRWPLLMCRIPLISGSGLILPAGEGRQEALDQITTLVQDFSRQHRASFILFDYLEGDLGGSERWQKLFSTFSFSEPGTALKIEWPTFEAYLDQLSKSAYKDYRRHVNRAEDQGIVITRHERVTDIDHAMQLIRNVEAHHGSQPNPHTRPLLEHAHLTDATWLTAEIEGKMVGCGLLVRDRGTQVLSLLGLDYDVKWVYFQLVYAAIRCAIETGTTLLRGGSGAYELKERLGFLKESNTHIAYTLNVPALRRVVHQLTTG